MVEIGGAEQQQILNWHQWKQSCIWKFSFRIFQVMVPRKILLSFTSLVGQNNMRFIKLLTYSFTQHLPRGRNSIPVTAYVAQETQSGGERGARRSHIRPANNVSLSWRNLGRFLYHYSGRYMSLDVVCSCAPTLWNWML